MDTNLLFVLMAIFLSGYYSWHTLMRMATPKGMRAKVRGEHARSTAIQIDETGWALFVQHEKGVGQLLGNDALRALTFLLPAINQGGASRKQIAEAISLIDRAGGPESFVAGLFTPQQLGAGLHHVFKMPTIRRIALEIAVNEEAERNTFRGDLAAIAIERDNVIRLADSVSQLG